MSDADMVELRRLMGNMYRSTFNLIKITTDAILQPMTEQERRVYCLRSAGFSYRQVVEDMGIGTEDVRRIEAEALVKKAEVLRELHEAVHKTDAES